jgi:hypothetical protein
MDEDDDMLSAMARELVEKNGIEETALNGARRLRVKEVVTHTEAQLSDRPWRRIGQGSYRRLWPPPTAEHSQQRM